MIRISVVIPVYNILNYLSDCIESILAQTYQPNEVILVDDGSTDGSEVLCDRYSKEYESVFVIHQNNQGLSEARNTGIRTSKGEYIFFLDGDDYIQNNTFELFDKLIKDNDNIDFIHGRMLEFVDGEKEYIESPYYLKSKVISGKQAFLEEFNKGSHIAMGIRGLYNRSFIINNNLFFKRGLYTEDQEWTMRALICADRIIGCEVPYYCYRMNRKGSLMNTLNPTKGKMLFEIYDGWFDYGKDKTGEFERALVVESACRARRSFWEFSQMLRGEDLEKYISIANQYNYLLRVGKTKNLKHLLLSCAISIFGCNRTAKILNRMRNY